jgi:hypothetical protein
MIAVVVRAFGTGRHSSAPTLPQARPVKGEIGREEYLRKKHNLGGQSVRPLCLIAPAHVKISERI